MRDGGNEGVGVKWEELEKDGGKKGAERDGENAKG